MTLTPIFFILFSLMIVAAFIAGFSADMIRRQRARIPSRTRYQSEVGTLLGKEALSQLFAANPLAMWIYDPQTLQFLDVNDAATAQYGYSRAAFLQMRLTDLHPAGYDAPPDKKEADQVANSVQDGLWRDGGQWRHVLHDGQVIDVHIWAHPIEFSGRTANFIAAQNITAQVQAEAELRTREAWWRALIEHSADMIAVVGSNGEFTYASPAIERVLGYTVNELSNSKTVPFGWLSALDDHDPTTVRWRDRLQTGTLLDPDEFGIPLEIRMRDKAGKWRWLEVILTRLLEVDVVRGVIVNAREITARVEAEQSLYAANENLQALIQFAPTPIIAQDRDQRVTVWNPAAEKLFGWREGEVLGQPNPVVFTPTSLAGDSPTSRNAQAQSDPFVETQSGRTIGMVSFRRDQTLVTASVSQGFIRDAAAKINGTISVLVDMTAQQNAQVKMRQQNDYLTALHDTALALLNRLDVDQLLSAILHKASAFLNTPDGYLGILDPATNRVVLRVGVGFYKPQIGTSMVSTDGLIGQVLSSKRLYVIDDYTNWVRRIDLIPGTHLYAAIGMPLTVGGQVIGVIGLIRLTPHQPFTLDEIAQLGQLVELACLALDNAQLYAAAQQELAERSRAEAALQQLNADLEQRIRARTMQLQQSEAELRMVFDSMSEGLIYFQTDLNTSRIEFANQAITELVGYRPADLVGQSFAIFDPTVLADKDSKQDFIHLASHGGVWRSERYWQRADGSRVWVALSVRQVHAGSDSRLRGVMIARDITAEKQLTDQKMRFIANASHELRTPLTHLKTRMYLIRRQPERAAEHLAVLDQSITRMITLVEDMLDTTRFEHGWGELERQYVIIQDLINELVSNIQPEIAFKKIRLTVDQPEQPLALQADPDRLIQVLNNLATNAINYTQEGGSMHIRVQSDAVTQAVIIEFEDSGIGLAAENYERVFEPFFRVELGTGRGVSLGLGLSIAREIVMLHGGSLTVSSELHVGSIFRVSLPIVPPALSTALPSVEAPESGQAD